MFRCEGMSRVSYTVDVAVVLDDGVTYSDVPGGLLAVSIVGLILLSRQMEHTIYRSAFRP